MLKVFSLYLFAAYASICAKNACLRACACPQLFAVQAAQAGSCCEVTTQVGTERQRHGSTELAEG